MLPRCARHAALFAPTWTGQLAQPAVRKRLFSWGSRQPSQLAFSIAALIAAIIRYGRARDKGAKPTYIVRRRLRSEDGDWQAQHGMAQIGSDFRQRDQREGPPRQTRM